MKNRDGIYYWRLFWPDRDKILSCPSSSEQILCDTCTERPWKQNTGINVSITFVIVIDFLYILSFFLVKIDHGLDICLSTPWDKADYQPVLTFTKKLISDAIPCWPRWPPLTFKNFFFLTRHYLNQMSINVSLIRCKFDSLSIPSWSILILDQLISTHPFHSPIESSHDPLILVHLISMDPFHSHIKSTFSYAAYSAKPSSGCQHYFDIIIQFHRLKSFTLNSPGCSACTIRTSSPCFGNSTSDSFLVALHQTQFPFRINIINIRGSDRWTITLPDGMSEHSNFYC